MLLDPGEPGAAEAIVNAALAASEHYDSWELEELSSEAGGLALPVADPAAEPRAQSACPVLPIGNPSTWANSKAGRLSQRAWNRLNRHPGIAIEPATAATVHLFVEDLLALHARRWRERGESGVLASPEVQAFHRQAAPDLLEAGMLRMVRLRASGRTLAVYYGFAHGRRAYGYLSGFDPDWSFESPGTALLGHAIQDAAQRGCTEFHFLRGREPYKYAFGAVDRWNQARTVRPASSLSRAADGL